MQRTILVTELKHKENNSSATVYGTKDGALKKLIRDGYEVTRVYNGLYVMEDEIFAKYGKLKSIKEN